MLDTRTSAALLAGATSAESLARLTTLLDFAAPSPLDPELVRAVGLDHAEASVSVATGRGALRALLVVGDGTTRARDLVGRLVRRLAARSPEPLWLLVVAVPSARELVLAVWDAGHSPPRVRALTVDQRHVVDSDAATFRAMHAATGSVVAMHAPDGSDEAVAVAWHRAWLDVLGRDSLTRRFYLELAGVVGSLASTLVTPGRSSEEERGDFALLYVSRLLFLSFVEARGWLDRDPAFLMHSFERCMLSGGSFHRRVLRPLFFGTLNTPPPRRARAARDLGRIPFLNGGLFAHTALERRLGNAYWDDAAIGELFQRLLGRYRFTAREDQQGWTDAAVDPEMLGRAFESLMNTGTRRTTGAFYTPPELVAHATRRALAPALRAQLGRGGISSPDADARLAESVLAGTAPHGAEAARVLRAVRQLRILDPACGSGAFLVHALETLAGLSILAGDERPVSVVRRELLASSIFGVDINPMAVWLCELRLWLSVLMDCEATDPFRVPPLPNLDHHVRVGDALAGGGIDRAGELDAGAAARLTRLRARYVRASGSRKRSLARSLDREERGAVIARLEAEVELLARQRRDLLAGVRGHDLFGDRARASLADRRQLEGWRAEARRLRARKRAVLSGAALPFGFATHFADVAAAGGFDLVLGNPPWVRPHRLEPSERQALRHAFETARAAAWATGAKFAGAGMGFGGQADLAALFVERAVSLVSPGGTFGLLLPAKLWRSLSGGGVRALLGRETRLVSVEDWSGSPHSFDAAVYPSLLVATRRESPRTMPAAAAPERSPGTDVPADTRRRGAAAGSPAAAPAPPGRSASSADRTRSEGAGTVEVAEWHGGRERRWRCAASSLTLDGDPGAPWLLLPAPARRAFDTLRDRGTPIALGPAGRPLLGVKTGCNDAYLFRMKPGALPAPLAASGVKLERLAGYVEPELLRPLVRGEDLRPWRALPTDAHILWPHDRTGAALATLPPGTARWFAEWRRRLERRTDVRTGMHWWGVFRTDGAMSDVHRVAWADMGRAPRATVLPPGDPAVLLNSCYTLRARSGDDAFALAALLNAPAMAAWLSVLAEPARGGYRRHLAWTLALLPLPRPWSRARPTLALLARRAIAGEQVTGGELDDALFHAFGVQRATLEPLLDWAAH